jgi:hypothetical protein
MESAQESDNEARGGHESGFATGLTRYRAKGDGGGVTVESEKRPVSRKNLSAQRLA